MRDRRKIRSGVIKRESITRSECLLAVSGTAGAASKNWKVFISLSSKEATGDASKDC